MSLGVTGRFDVQICTTPIYNMYIYISVCVCLCVYTYIHTYIHIYIYNQPANSTARFGTRPDGGSVCVKRWSCPTMRFTLLANVNKKLLKMAQSNIVDCPSYEMVDLSMAKCDSSPEGKQSCKVRIQLQKHHWKSADFPADEHSLSSGQRLKQSVRSFLHFIKMCLVGWSATDSSRFQIWHLLASTTYC